MSKFIKKLQLFLLCVVMLAMSLVIVACADTVYKVSFDTQGGGTVSDQKVTEGDLVEKPANVSKTGYSLDGWYTSIDYVTKWDFEKDTAKNDLTLVAKWVANQYTISFDINGGNEAIDEIDVTYGQSFVLPVPEKSGFIFNGWYKGTQLVESGVCDFTEDLTLVAQWEQEILSQQDLVDALAAITRIFEQDNQPVLMSSLNLTVSEDLKETDLRYCPIGNVVRFLSNVLESDKFQGFETNKTYQTTTSDGLVFIRFDFFDDILTVAMGNYVDLQNDLYFNIGFKIEYNKQNQTTGDFVGGVCTRLSVTSQKGYTYYLYKKDVNKLYDVENAVNEHIYDEQIEDVVSPMMNSIDSAINTNADYTEEYNAAMQG